MPKRVQHVYTLAIVVVIRFFFKSVVVVKPGCTFALSFTNPHKRICMRWDLGIVVAKGKVLCLLQIRCKSTVTCPNRNLYILPFTLCIIWIIILLTFCVVKLWNLDIDFDLPCIYFTILFLTQSYWFIKSELKLMNCIYVPIVPITCGIFCSAIYIEQHMLMPKMFSEWNVSAGCSSWRLNS